MRAPYIYVIELVHGDHRALVSWFFDKSDAEAVAEGHRRMEHGQSFHVIEVKPAGPIAGDGT